MGRLGVAVKRPTRCYMLLAAFGLCRLTPHSLTCPTHPPSHPPLEMQMNYELEAANTLQFQRGEHVWERGGCWRTSPRADRCLCSPPPCPACVLLSSLCLHTWHGSTPCPCCLPSFSSHSSRPPPPPHHMLCPLPACCRPGLPPGHRHPRRRHRGLHHRRAGAGLGGRRAADRQPRRRRAPAVRHAALRVPDPAAGHGVGGRVVGGGGLEPHGAGQELTACCECGTVQRAHCRPCPLLPPSPRCSLLHADPHPGNLLRTTDGRIAILDHGLIQVPPCPRAHLPSLPAPCCLPSCRTSCAPRLTSPSVAHHPHLASHSLCSSPQEIPRDYALALMEYIAHLSVGDWDRCGGGAGWVGGRAGGRGGGSGVTAGHRGGWTARRACSANSPPAVPPSFVPTVPVTLPSCPPACPQPC